MTVKTDTWRIEELNTTFSPFQTYACLKDKNSVFLNSAGDKINLARYSIIACQPEIVFKAKNRRVEVTSETGTEILKGNPFEILAHLFEEEKNRFTPDSRLPTPDFLPYVSGPIGFFSYDCKNYIEKLPNLTNDDLNIQDMYLFFPKVVIVFDKMTGRSYLISANEEVKQETIGRLKKELITGSFSARDVKTNMDRLYFENSVSKIIDYIYSGDVYQVNFSQRFEACFEGDPLSLFQKLCNINPSPFSAYLELEDFAIISSSPERLVHLKEGVVQTRPIAGTRRRGQNDNEDSFLKGHLLLDEKEKAEHIMLVDLERNDIGRVCEYGSVLPSEIFTIEKYSHVIHIVSNIKGRLKQVNTAFDLVKAVFPGGTITGCPKVRCMEIIEELEPTKRGPYTGSIGYLSFNGGMDLNIIIRSFVLKNNRLYFQAGAGIVADSVPKREYFETVSKANALFESLGVCPKEVKWERMFS